MQSVSWQAQRAVRLAELGFADPATYLECRHVAQGWSTRWHALAFGHDLPRTNPSLTAARLPAGCARSGRRRAARAQIALQLI